ncbi:MAG: hypothetical protein CMA12_00050, partial [Euryarchaeota archaeon]|nr:hypothetical protein [Euryarchaeota archaeon]
MSLKLFLNFTFIKIFLIIFFTNFAYGSKKIELDTAGNYCDLEFGLSKSFTSSNIKIIKIKVNKNKKWIKNSMNIIKLKKYSIPEKYKKTFEGDIEIHTNDGLICNFKAKLRQHGDWKDHIDFNEGKLEQSLDINLLEGNITGITSFKLFLPETRNFKNEIFFTYLLKQIGYLAPRTFIIDMEFLGNKSKMLLQEKIVKEFLENNLLKEGPILEGDENLLWSKNEDLISQNSESFRLARIDNVNWIKNKDAIDISTKALTTLNYAYFKYLSEIKNYSDPMKSLNLDNKILSNNNEKHKLFLDTFDLLMLAADGYHGLIEHNRKFYYDAIKDNFIPIYYDGNLNLNINNYYGSLDLKNEFVIQNTLSLLDKVNIDLLYENLKKSNVLFEKSEINNYIKNIKKNIRIIQNKVKVKKNKFDNNLIQYIGSKNTENLLFAFQDRKSNQIIICNNQVELCENLEYKTKDILSLLSQRLEIDESPVIFLGNISTINFSLNFDLYEKYKIAKLNNYLKLQNTTIYYNEGIDLKINKNNIKITQLSNSGRVLFQNGDLIKKNIIFEGLDKEFNDDNLIIERNYLSGCLTFFDMNISDLNIYFKNSICEDAINLLHVNGHIEKINVINSKSDALDIDFSNVEINFVEIKNAFNDCLDFSFGNYLL